MKDANFNSVSLLLSKLKHNPADFEKKMEYARYILKDLGVLRINGTL